MTSDTIEPNMEYIGQIDWHKAEPGSDFSQPILPIPSILGDNSVPRNFYYAQQTYLSWKYLGFSGKNIQTELPWS